MNTPEAARSQPLDAPDIRIDAAALDGRGVMALRFAPDGGVAWRTPAAESLAEAVSMGRVPGLSALVRQAATGKMGAENVIVNDGRRLVYDLIALPLADGEGVLVLVRDVTLDRNLRLALIESRQRYKDLVEIGSDFSWETDEQGRLAFVSPRGALGYAAQELVGRDPSMLIAEILEVAGDSPFSVREPVENLELWMKHAEGQLVCVSASAAPLLGPEGEWLGARGVCRDITHIREREAELARARNRERLIGYIVRTFRDKIDPDAMLSTAAAAVTRAVGASGCHILRVVPDHGATLPMSMVCAARFGEPETPEAGRAVLSLRRDEEQELIEGLDPGSSHLRVVAVLTRHQGEINGALVLWRPADRGAWLEDERLLVGEVADQLGIVLEQVNHHERILTMSRTDPLTGLFNRRAFFDELERRYARLLHGDGSAALIFLDLDNFKLVNDVHGHPTGDAALLALRDLLTRTTRPTDLVARLGGDEFAVWLEGADAEIAGKRARVILEEARSLEQYSGTFEHPLGLSLGVAVHEGQARESLDGLMLRADKAMYEAKRSGKNRLCIACAAPMDAKKGGEAEADRAEGKRR